MGKYGGVCVCVCVCFGGGVHISGIWVLLCCIRCVVYWLLNVLHDMELGYKQLHFSCKHHLCLPVLIVYVHTYTKHAVNKLYIP